MKLPSRILGLIAAAAAAPVIAGCASESTEPTANKTDQKIHTQASSEEEKEASEKSEEPQTALAASSEAQERSAPDAVPTPDPSSTSSKDDAPPDDGMPRAAEDAPLKGIRPAVDGGLHGGPASLPQRGTSGQEPCPACGMG